ncbi:unnamed protein product [Phyllotreta striolata]|uniref:Beta-mannosidase B n=1 Tax=Phyllotreta striolata TaxID=444603 RepID=A0A9N9TE29_PHYSR|nr:unnamed protein product [Phyllotreta striolata]
MIGWALFISFFVTVCKSDEIIDLDGNNWFLRDGSGEFKNLRAVVPGGVYSDLMRHEIIEDIFKGYNDNATKWVPRRNWTYSTTFNVKQDVLNSDNVNIVFEGLDTFARVVVNGKDVGGSNNMFVQYIMSIKDVLKVGSNSLEVQFRSPIEVAAALEEEQDKQYVVPPKCPPGEYRGECYANMIRKMQASFSWDWGPAFPSVGIWKKVYIESYQESKIRYIGTEITDDQTNWYLNVDIYLANNAKGAVNGAVKIDINGLTNTVNVQAKPDNNGEIKANSIFTVPKTTVETWWPNGYGKQTLYKLQATFTNNQGETNSKTVRVGFRSIELVQEQLGSGLSFYFKVNGVPIFMKGSNEIPLSILPEKGHHRSLIETMLNTAQENHMNMLRVWGGGVYESDYFYDLADEKGILIWQDFMFACAMYPTGSDYLLNVVQEIRHQVNRLRSHPSIALFAGNNENEGALRDNWYGTQDNFQTYYNDYIKLYINTVQTELKERISPNRIFLSSSPSNGLKTINEGYVSQNPGDYNYGDVHFYNYENDPWNSNIYPVCRFASEYGYQSLPSLSSWRKVTNDPEDLNINGRFMEHRQHHPEGTSQLKNMIEMNLKLPDETSADYTKSFVYLSQVVQALAIRIETEHYRRYRSNLNSAGQGHTMGALYWQLNDVWVAPTWSGIDFLGNQKMLQYFVKDAFAPVIITGHINDQRTLEIYVVSDRLETIPNVTASIQVFKWDSFNPVHTENITLDVSPSESKLIKSIETDEFLAEQNCGSKDDAKNNCFFYFTLNAPGHDQVAPVNYVFPAPLKNSNLKRPTVVLKSVTQVDTKPFKYYVKIGTDVVTPFVWLESSIQGRFENNGLLLTSPATCFEYTATTDDIDIHFINSVTITHL